jgi:hypothetical protein
MRYAEEHVNTRFRDELKEMDTVNVTKGMIEEA